MALNSASIEKTGAWYGFLDGICLIVFALILKLTGLEDVPLLRIGFILISVYFICLSISSLKAGRIEKFTYLNGLGVGTITSIISALMLGAFVIAAIMLFDSNFVEIVRAENLLGEHVTVSSIFMVITMFGIVGGALTSFIAMQFFKRPDHKISQ